MALCNIPAFLAKAAHSCLIAVLHICCLALSWSQVSPSPPRRLTVLPIHTMSHRLAVLFDPPLVSLPRQPVPSCCGLADPRRLAHSCRRGLPHSHALGAQDAEGRERSTAHRERGMGRGNGLQHRQDRDTNTLAIRTCRTYATGALAIKTCRAYATGMIDWWTGDSDARWTTEDRCDRRRTTNARQTTDWQARGGWVGGQRATYHNIRLQHQVRGACVLHPPHPIHAAAGQTRG